MGHVVRQDKEAFDNRSGKDDRDGEGNILNHVAKAARQGRQAKEGGNRRQGRRQHRRGHPADGGFGGDQRRFAQSSDAKIGVFADDDGVVHDDAKRQDQREKRDHVEGQPEGLHHRHRRQHGDRNARRDPEGRARVQEQEQDRDHKAKAHRAVLDQDIQPRPDVVGPDPDHVDLDPGGQRLTHLFRDLLDGCLNVEGIALGRTVDP